jgi:hypothetical protein
MEASWEVNAMSEQKIEEFYRDATADDVAMLLRTNELQDARFRNRDDEGWQRNAKLMGCCIHWGRRAWMDEDMAAWKCCQVYDPPEILKNKPDPGEGYRLLEKFPHEALQKGDEAFDNNRDGRWGESAYAETGLRDQCESLWYRRRIETNSPTSLDSSRSRDDIPSGWRVLGKDEERLASDAFWSLGCKEWLLIGDDRVKYANELPRWRTIRQVDYQADYALLVGFTYPLPNGSTIRVTAKGFEVQS